MDMVIASLSLGGQGRAGIEVEQQAAAAGHGQTMVVAADGAQVSRRIRRGQCLPALAAQTQHAAVIADGEQAVAVGAEVEDRCGGWGVLALPALAGVDGVVDEAIEAADPAFIQADEAAGVRVELLRQATAGLPALAAIGAAEEQAELAGGPRL